MAEPDDAPTKPKGVLAWLGLDRPELRAWAMYDWANSVFMTIVLLIFPIYFSSVAAKGLSAARASFLFAMATTVSMAIVAVMSPFLGAAADYAAAKKKMLAAFLGLGVVTTGALALVGEGDWVLGAVLFVLGNIGVTSSIVFYESLLPHLCREEELDRVSSAGYAMGYVGGGLSMAVSVLADHAARPAGHLRAGGHARVVPVRGGLVGRVLDPALPPRPRAARRGASPGEDARSGPLKIAVARLRETLRDMRLYKQTFLFLLAFLVYNDAIGTIIRMASIYGTEMGLDMKFLIGALLVVQFVGIPFSFLFGAIASRIGAKNAIFITLAVYLVISVFGYFMDSRLEFLIMAGLVGTVQGGSQALSRSLFTTMVPKHKASEFFAFFSVFEKFAGILGPLVFAVMIRATGSSRGAILSLILFFLVGGALLAMVDVEKGQRAAREAEARAREGA